MRQNDAARRRCRFGPARRFAQAAVRTEFTVRSTPCSEHSLPLTPARVVRTCTSSRTGQVNQSRRRIAPSHRRRRRRNSKTAHHMRSKRASRAYSRKIAPHMNQLHVQTCLKPSIPNVTSRACSNDPRPRSYPPLAHTPLFPCQFAPESDCTSCRPGTSCGGEAWHRNMPR